MSSSKTITPKADAIAKDLVRVVADVLDFGYKASGTSEAGFYIGVRKTKKGKVKVTICPKSTL